jgi:hypothetical protein
MRPGAWESIENVVDGLGGIGGGAGVTEGEVMDDAPDSNGVASLLLDSSSTTSRCSTGCETHHAPRADGGVRYSRRTAAPR